MPVRLSFGKEIRIAQRGCQKTKTRSKTLDENSKEEREKGSKLIEIRLWKRQLGPIPGQSVS